MLKQLNQEQRTAIKHNRGPLLVIAGAGTGKTKVITHRLAYLIKERGIKPENILALTFTDKAAEEMEKRVDILLPYGLVDTWISTFHAFGDRILRDEAILAGLSPDFKVMTKVEQVLFIREHLSDFKLKILKPVTNPTKNIESLLEVFSRAKDENISPKEYSEKAKKLEPVQKEIAQAYDTYEKLKRKANLLDFSDQVYLTYHLLKDNPELLKKYQKQFEYILVDEFQDTNYLQNELVKLLSQPQGNLTVVGDDDQSIYAFRGSSLTNIQQFKEDFPKVKQIILTKNYRSSQKILDSAYRLIKHNNPNRLEVQNKIKKKLKSQTKQGTEPKLKIFDLIQNEADYIAQEISDSVEGKKNNYRDIAILVRSNSQAEPFIQALKKAGIPWVFSGQSGLYQESEIQLLTSFLRAVSSNYDNLALYHLAQSPIYQLPINYLIELLDFSRSKHLSLFWVMKKKLTLNRLKLSKDSQKIIEQIISDIEKYRLLSKTKPAGQILYQFIQDKKIIDRLTRQQTTKSEVQIKNISDFFNRIKEYEKIVQDKSLQKIVQYLDSLIESGENPELTELEPDLDAVSVLTVHSAKGLEFDTVFIGSLTSDRFPTYQRGRPLELPEQLIREDLPEKDQHLQEERRLFYVGMTRAENQLYLSMSYNCGGQRQKRPSPFLTEALGKETIESVSQEKLDQIEQIELFGSSDQKKIYPDLKKSRKPLYLSPGKIDDYLTCPLKYKYVAILKAPLTEHFNVVLGNALHQAIEFYLKHKMKGKTISLDQMLEKFSNSWRNQGYFSAKHEKESKQIAEQALKNWLKKEEDQPTPVSVEESFSIKHSNSLVAGRWDAAYPNNGGIELIDFKSSDVPDEKKAKDRVYRNRQLDFYTWGYFQKHGQLPNQVGLYFLVSGNKSFKKTSQRTIQKAQKAVEQAEEGIRNRKFPAKPSQFNCGYCAFKKICPYSVK